MIMIKNYNEKKDNDERIMILMMIKKWYWKRIMIKNDNDKKG